MRIIELQPGETEKPNLIIDEVHNLPHRSMEYYSPTLEANFFIQLQNALEKYPHAFQKKLDKALADCLWIISNCAIPNRNSSHLIECPQREFKKQEEKLNELLNAYLESELTIEDNDPVLKLINYWSDFTAALDFVSQGNAAFFTSFDPAPQRISISCCDASNFLKDYYRNFAQVIGFSATLKPFNYYSQLIGLSEFKLKTQEFMSPFLKERRKLMIIPQISSKYSDRARSYPKIMDAITRITAIKPGNYFIFFPSFDFLDKVFILFKSLSSFQLIRQEKGMREVEVKDLLNRLHRKKMNHLFFAVQGGMFAEGIDYAGDLAIGAFIVGPPLPQYNWEREQMKLYYENQYHRGKEYAYIYPAMAKAVQAAGRVIRSESDAGLIILFDNRFLEPSFSQCMPSDWFMEDPKELVSKSILNDIKEFWEDLE